MKSDQFNQDLARIERESKERREKYAAQHPKFAELILTGKICAGMGANDVRASMGTPQAINVPGGIGLDLEQWVYVRENVYVYFDKGIVTRHEVTRKP